MSTNIRPLQPAELAWANACYTEVKFQASSPSDFIALAETEQGKAGLGRLVRIDAHCAELGGIYILPAYRGHGLARAIVDFLLQHSPYETLYCIPFTHLEPFYRGFGFVPLPQGAALPCAIAEKLNWCRQQYAPAISLLVRTKTQDLLRR